MSMSEEDLKGMLAASMARDPSLGLKDDGEAERFKKVWHHLQSIRHDRKLC